MCICVFTRQDTQKELRTNSISHTACTEYTQHKHIHTSFFHGSCYLTQYGQSENYVLRSLDGLRAQCCMSCTIIRTLKIQRKPYTNRFLLYSIFYTSQFTPFNAYMCVSMFQRIHAVPPSYFLPNAF